MEESTERRGLSTSEAARRLGVDRATVINMINDGRLRAARGNQPVKPRWIIETNAEGLLISAAGEVLPNQSTSNAESLAEQLDRLVSRVEALEVMLGSNGNRLSEVQRLREAALLLAATNEKQREAQELGSRANQLLSEALAEQGRIIATLLVPDVIMEDL